MINIQTIQKFLKSQNPSWNITKIMFVGWLILRILDSHKKQSIDIPKDYDIIEKKGNKTLWFDAKSNTYAIQGPNDITPFNNIQDAKKHL